MTAVQRILAPVDGSRFAELALPVAANLAHRANAALQLVTVAEPPAFVPTLEGGLIPADDAETRRKAAAEYLAEAASRLDTVGSPGVSTAVIEGRPGVALAEHIAWWRPDLVVMATHGRGAISRAWLGSVADYLVRHISVPLLLLRPKDSADWAAGALTVRTIMLPLDLSGLSEAILEPASILAKLTGATIELVYVLEPVMGIQAGPIPVGIAPDLSQHEPSRPFAEARLADIAERLRQTGIEVKSTVVAGPLVAATLLELARGPCDLVAMATHGRGGLRRSLLGSVADKLVRGSGKPVLVVRPPN